ncbi:hypothetical protein SEMRO_120_G058520.1 [Seminavis robusta]|uniref:Uncharacterized protein n=1 Tax=Seminavis robusta TaxID=568900 RepID=A0A9N8DF60_9STRA|nr:hypothetical protein SEMRO_120_G058520.1 [Seminavis robusta]|eukprot:Sro120_g058520.1 n/a (593) ;mRNA; f:62263-64041
MASDDSDGSSLDIERRMRESDERHKRKRDEEEAEVLAAAPVIPVATAASIPTAAAAPVPLNRNYLDGGRPRLSLWDLQQQRQMQMQQLHQQRALTVPLPPLPYYEDPIAQDMYMGQLKAQESRERPPRCRAASSPSPAVRSRSASPAVRSASPAERKVMREAAKAGQKKKKEDEKNAKKAADAKQAQRIKVVIDKYDPLKKQIVCGEEENPSDKEMYRVAKTLVYDKGEPNEMTFDLTKFNSTQIRELCLKCQVKGGGNMKMFDARKEIARSIEMGTMYNDKTVSNLALDPLATKINTLVKLMNICFHPSIYPYFVSLNDSNNRKEFEREPLSQQGVTGNPFKDFWLLVSEHMNETNETVGEKQFDDVLGLQEGEDEHLLAYSEGFGFNLNDIDRGQTNKSVQRMVSDMMKSRDNCLAQMKISGEHSNDIWTYCIVKRWCIPRKGMAAVPAIAVYYCDYLCRLHPTIIGKFATFLEDSLKSDSTVDMTGTADAASGKGSKLAVADVMESLTSVGTELKESIGQRKENAEDAAETNQWDGYLAVANQYLKIVQEIKSGDSSKAPLARVMEIRLGRLEKKLNIPAESSLIVGPE